MEFVNFFFSLSCFFFKCPFDLFSTTCVPMAVCAYAFSTGRLNEHPLRCEACRLTVENTLFAAPALAQWRRLKPPPTTEEDPMCVKQEHNFDCFLASAAL
jgi:hypothetical protein